MKLNNILNNIVHNHSNEFRAYCGCRSCSLRDNRNEILEDIQCIHCNKTAIRHGLNFNCSIPNHMFIFNPKTRKYK